MRKHTLPASETTTVLHATPHRVSPRSWHHRLRVFDATRGAFWSAALLCSAALLTSSSASAQWACTTDASGAIDCTNAGTGAGSTETTSGANQSITQTNSGSNTGSILATTSGNNSAITQTNSGSNATVIDADTSGNNSAITQTNSGSNTGLFSASTTGVSSAITQTNSGSNTLGISASTSGVGSAITQTNSGSNTLGAGSAVMQTNSGSNNSGGIAAQTSGVNSAVAVTNSGSNTGVVSAFTVGANSGVTVTNSGSNTGVGSFISVFTIGANSNITVNNSGRTNTALLTTAGAGSTETLINSGIISGSPDFGGIAIQIFGGPATLTNILGSRVIGDITLAGATNAVNFVGGNWLFTFQDALAGTTINTNGAPFVVSGNQVAVLDPTSFALADRALTNFTGEVQQMLQGRFDGMFAGGGGGGSSSALGFAGAPSTQGVADQATQAFAGIPSVAMSYASNPRPLLGKVPAAAAPYYDTTIWASGFGGERKQNADGVVLPATDIAYGGALGIDRAFGPNLRLGAFAGGGASREDVELSVQSIDSTYAFGGGYGRFDWATQYLDFSLYGGSISNSSTRGIANNTVASGFETATASYGGWFISPALSYGYRIPLNNNVLVTPRVSVRYVGGSLDGYSESGSEQDLSVGRRAINDFEERAELEFSTLKPVSWGGTVKSTISVGAIGLERLGDQTIDTVLLGQNLSFITPGQVSAVGGVVDAGIQYHPVGNVSLFISGEGTAMSDRSYSGAGTGGMRVSF
ncbi:MAG: autotransporter domain-containing protein [Xanthobacteraceae bacterium]